jgi:prophage tail gpP-like protein
MDAGVWVGRAVQDTAVGDETLQLGTVGMVRLASDGDIDATLQQRAQHESNVAAMNKIRVWISLVGWQRPNSGGLWLPGMDDVVVDSPMLVLHNQPLLLWAVTYTQDDRGGTTAELELVNDLARAGSEPTF